MERGLATVTMPAHILVVPAPSLPSMFIDSTRKCTKISVWHSNTCSSETGKKVQHCWGFRSYCSCCIPVSLTAWPALLQQHDVGPAQLCQVVGYRWPDDASSTNHHTGLAGQGERLRVPAGCQTPRRGPQAPVGQSEARLRKQQSGEEGRGQSPGAPHTAAHNWAFCGRKQPIC